MHRVRLLFVLVATLAAVGWVSPTPSYAAPATVAAYHATATVSNAHPTHNSHATITGVLKGAQVASATMLATWYYKTTTSTCTAITNTKGVASCARSISRATSGFLVRVTVSFRRAGVLLASATTGFTPR
jgi:hypothetical protein